MDSNNNQQQMTAEQLAALRAVMPKADMSNNMVQQGQAQQQTYMSPNDIAQRQQAQQQQSAPAPTQPQPTTQAQQSAPAPTPQLRTPNQNQSGTAAMHARMMAAKNGQQSTQATQLQQGDTYNPNSSPAQHASPEQNQQQPTQAPDVNSIANNTIINTTDTSNEGKKSGFAWSKSLALVVVGVGLLVVLGIILIVSRGGGNNPDGSQIAADDWNEDDLEWITPDSYYSYNIDQIEELRSVGYTGAEIENAQTQQIPAADLIRQARAARNAYVQMTLAPMYDTASYEYKNFIEQTWLTLPERDDMFEWQNIASYYDVRENLDYEKINVYGSQLFIKVYLDDNYHEDWFFCMVTPDEWLRLEDYGNIVVNYRYATRYDGDDIWTAEEDFDNIYIISASIEFTN